MLCCVNQFSGARARLQSMNPIQQEAAGGGVQAMEDSKLAAARARDALRVSADECARVDALSSTAAPTPAGASSFFEGFALRGVRVHRIHPGVIACSFTVPPRLTDSTTGCLAAGAVVSLVDEIGGAAAIADGHHLKVSVDMSVSFASLSQAAPGDHLHITARVLGHKGAYSGTHVLITNAATGEVVAEGRHSLFGKMKNKATNTTVSSTTRMSKM